jgi:hypothetical protein
MFAQWRAWWRGATLEGRVTQLERDVSYDRMAADMIREELFSLRLRVEALEDGGGHESFTDAFGTGGSA